MASVTDILRKTALHTLATRCAGSGCNVSLSGLPGSRAVVDLDSAAAPIDRTKPYCDYLIGCERTAEPNGLLVALELKRTIRAGEVVRQLGGGAAIAEQWLGRVQGIRFVPVAAGSVHRQELTQLRQRLVRFQGKDEPVQLIRCGDPLMKALR